MNWRWGAGIIAASGLFFALLGVSRPLWFDEICSAQIIRFWPVDRLVQMLQNDSGPPLYYLLLRGWVALWGESAASLRTLSGIFYFGSIVFTGLLAKQIGGGYPHAALWSAFLYAVSAMAIRHAQTARPYALTGLFVALSTWLLVRAADSPDRVWRHWLAYALAALAGLYTHYIFLFAVLGQIALVLFRYGWRALPPLAIAGVVVVAGYLPWLPILMKQMGNGGVNWMLRPSWELFVTGLWAPFGRGWITLGVYALLAFPLLGGWSRRKEGAIWMPLFGMVAATFATIFAISFFKPIYLPSRSTILLMAPLTAFLGGLWAAIGQPQLRMAAAVLLLLGTSAGFVRYVAAPPAEDSGPAIAHILQQGRPGNIILCTNITYWPVEYTLRQAGAARMHEMMVFPSAILAHPGMIGRVEQDVGKIGLQQEANQLVDRIQADLTRRPQTTVWMLYGDEAHLTSRLRDLWIKNSGVRCVPLTPAIFLPNSTPTAQSLLPPAPRLPPLCLSHPKIARPPIETWSGTAGSVISQELLQGYGFHGSEEKLYSWPLCAPRTYASCLEVQ